MGRLTDRAVGTALISVSAMCREGYTAVTVPVSRGPHEIVVQTSVV